MRIFGSRGAGDQMPAHTQEEYFIGIVVAAALSASAPPAPADELRMGGAGAVPTLLERLGAICTQGSETKVVVIPGLATSGGIRALSDRVLDIAVFGRPLKPEEAANGLAQVASVRTPYVLITSHPSPNGLRGTEVADIYGSVKTTWADGTRCASSCGRKAAPK